MDDVCPDGRGPFKVTPDYVVGVDDAGTAYPDVMVCLALHPALGMSGGWWTRIRAPGPQGLDLVGGPTPTAK